MDLIKTKMTTTTKNKTIESIVKITKKVGDSTVFDKLYERDEKYLNKLLLVCKNLKKQK